MHQVKEEAKSWIHILLSNQDALETLGMCLAQNLKEGNLVLLSGPMGVGKTTFARALMKTLAHVENVPSAAYPLVMPLTTKTKKPLWFCDFFRLENVHELHETGIDEILADALAIVIVEWPDILLKDRPLEPCVNMDFSYHRTSSKERHVSLSHPSSFPLEHFRKCLKKNHLHDVSS